MEGELGEGRYREGSVERGNRSGAGGGGYY